MKKIIFLVICAVLSLGSCDDQDAAVINCITTTADLATATDAYADDPSTENCNQYKEALQVFINNGCAQTNQDTFEALLDALPCN
tara:strand:+ start:620 stop:874 length:255 start_codon:yes stop_codon:yes gene_type:complete